MTKKLYLTVLLAAALGLGACGDKAADNPPAPTSAPVVSQTDVASTPSTPKQPEKPVAASFIDPAPLQAAEDALRALPQFQGKKLKVFQDVNFYAGESGLRIIINVQDPNKPENVDNYEYRNGKWGEPTPVRITGDGKMDDNLTDLDKIQFATVAKVAEQWETKAKEVEANEQQLTFVSFILWVPNQSRFWSTPDIESPRAAYFIRFKADGSLQEFKKK